MEGIVAFPKCQRCKVGDLLPLSDYGGNSATIMYKAWVCSLEECKFNIKIRNGEIHFNEQIRTQRNIK